MGAEDGFLRCPSAQPGMPDATVLGVVRRGAEGPRLAYLEAALPVSDDIVALARPAPPLQVLRFAARCEESRCVQFDGRTCSLAARIVERLDPVEEALPRCSIRGSCRWFAEQRGAACLRCPQVVTEAEAGMADLARATPAPRAVQPPP